MEEVAALLKPVDNEKRKKMEKWSDPQKTKVKFIKSGTYGFDTAKTPLWIYMDCHLFKTTWSKNF